jgi:Ca2+-binding EF-hand superfamily protein
MSYGGDGTNIYGLRADQLHEIQAAFHQFDADHNGYITGDEVRQCLLRTHVRFNDFDIQRVLSQMDYNRDGRVSYDEFMLFMARTYRGEMP